MGEENGRTVIVEKQRGKNGAEPHSQGRIISRDTPTESTKQNESTQYSITV